MISTSQRLKSVPTSPIRRLVPLADEAKARGIKVIHLNIGDPDIPTPPVMINRLKSWSEGIPYAHSQGDKELLTALQGYYADLGCKFIRTENIQVTVGGSEALGMTMSAVCDPGDEILVFEPFFTGYAGLAPIYGVKLVPVTTTIADGFHLPSKADIEAKITPKTKAILFTNPNNPTGTVYTKEEVELLIQIAKEKDLYLLCDEVYREFVFQEGKGVSLLDYMEQEPERLIVLDSLSKRYSAPGLRLGMIVSLNQELMAGFLRMAMARLSAGYIDQKAAATLSKVSHEEILQVRDEYQRRRDVIYKVMTGIPGVTMNQPEGAFYCVASLPVSDAEKFCAFLLTDFNDQGETLRQAQGETLRQAQGETLRQAQGETLRQAQGETLRQAQGETLRQAQGETLRQAQGETLRQAQGETVMLAPMAGFYGTPGMGMSEVRLAYVVDVEKLNRAGEILAKALAEYRKIVS